MMIIFFKPAKTTVNGDYYGLDLKIFEPLMPRMRHELTGHSTEHKDNNRLLVATCVQQYSSKCNIQIMPYPPQNPNLELCDF